MKIKKKPQVIDNLLEDLGRFGTEGGPMSEQSLNAALNMLVRKHRKYTDGPQSRADGEVDVEAQQLYDIDPSRLRTYYTSEEEMQQNYQDAYPFIVSGGGAVGAGLYRPEKMGKGETPIYKTDSKSRTGQKLIGKYVRDENGQMKAVYFDAETIDLINKGNRIKGQ